MSEVLADGQLGVERVLLGHDAESGADPRPVGDRVEARGPCSVAVGHRRDAADHPHRRGLAGAVRAEEAERLARRDVEVDGVDRGELAEPLRQAAGVDERFWAGGAPTSGALAAASVSGMGPHGTARAERNDSPVAVAFSGRPVGRAGGIGSQEGEEHARIARSRRPIRRGGHRGDTPAGRTGRGQGARRSQHPQPASARVVQRDMRARRVGHPLQPGVQRSAVRRRAERHHLRRDRAPGVADAVRHRQALLRRATATSSGATIARPMRASSRIRRPGRRSTGSRTTRSTTSLPSRATTRPALLTISGQGIRVSVPSGRTVLVDAGRLVIDVATDTVIHSGGPHHFDDYFIHGDVDALQPLCDALA